MTPHKEGHKFLKIGIKIGFCTNKIITDNKNVVLYVTVNVFIYYSESLIKFYHYFIINQG